MNFLKPGQKINWKYAIGEILLLFIGIYLAIWFNNCNTSEKVLQDKKIAIAKIAEEIENNMSELDSAGMLNEQIILAYKTY